MKRLLLLLPFFINQSFAQTYAPDPDFCFRPVIKNFDSGIAADDDYLSRQKDGGYVFTSHFNIINGQKVENQPSDTNVKLYFKFDKHGNLVPSYRFLSNDKYVFRGQTLKSGKMLWCESDIGVTNVRLVRINENGSMDSNFKYYGFESFVYKKYVLSSGKIIVSVDNAHHKVINEDGSLASKGTFTLPADMFPISNCFYNNNDYLLAGSFDKTCKVYRINPDFTLKEIYSASINSSNWLSYSKIYVDPKGRIYLNLFEGDSYISKIIRLYEDGKEDATFKNITITKAPELDPYTAKLTFTDSGKIVFSRRSIIMFFNEDGTQDTSFRIPLTENNRIIYDVTEGGEVLMLQNKVFRKVDFNGNILPFQLKLEMARPIGFSNILNAGKGRYYAMGDNYIGRFDLNGKIDSEFFSPDTALIFKKYFDKQLLIKRGNTNFIFSENGLKETKIPDVLANGTLDYAGRKAYMVEEDKIVRYSEEGKEEYRFAHNIPKVKQLFVLANRKLLVIGKLLTNEMYEGMFYMYRINMDGSVDKDFKTVELNLDGFISRNFEIKELPNGSVCVRDVVISEITRTIIRLFDVNGKELTSKATNDFGSPLFGNKIFDPKVSTNNTILFLDYSSQIKRWTSQAVLDSSFFTKGVSNITAFETIDSTSLFVASNEKVFKISTRKQRYITLQVPNQIDVEGAPIIIKATASDGSTVELSNSGEGILKDSVLTWTRKGNGKIEAKFKDNDCYSVSMNYGIGEFNPVYLNGIPTLKTNSPPYTLSFLFPVDTSLVKFEVIGEAFVRGNILYLKGKPGTVCLKAIKSNRNNNITLSSTACFEVEGEIITGTEPQQNLDKMIKLFPNPSPDGFYLQTGKAYALTEESFQLVHISGKTIPLHLVKEREDLYFLKPHNKPAAGVYLINFKLDDQIITRRIMIE